MIDHVNGLPGFSILMSSFPYFSMQAPLGMNLSTLDRLLDSWYAILPDIIVPLNIEDNLI